MTGVSVACALGFEIDELWRGLLEGRCGISRVPGIPDDSPFPVRIAGCIDNASLAAALPRYNIDALDRNDQLGLYAVGRALEDAGLPTDGGRELEMDLIVGSGHGGVAVSNEASRAVHVEGYRKMRPTTVVRAMMSHMVSSASIRYKLVGASFAVSCACASAAIALSEAFLRVRYGEAEAAMAACSDTGLDPATFAAWNRLGVLSRIPDPAAACRPFDKNRNGFVLGEGAAGLVLEPLESAQTRGARIWAEVLACASSSDARHIVQPDSTGQVKAVRKALTAAGLKPEDIGYVNAHGTATELSDVVESASLREVFGAHTDRLPVSNTKAQLGHLMGATAGVELVTTLLVMKHGLIPPCRNLDEPDPRCRLNFVRNEPLKTPVTHALKNSFAFGGTNCAIVLKRWPA